MKAYDNLVFKWLPFLMFTQQSNYRSSVVNTDSKGFRFNSSNEIKKNSVFYNESDQKNVLILGGSTAFGVGSTSDEKTISSYLSSSDTRYINLASRAHIGFQELISLFSNFDKLKNIKKIIIISGINDLHLSEIIKTIYPDNFYFNQTFINNMNNSRVNFSHKIVKFFLNYFYPDILNKENIYKLNISNFFYFIKSPSFRKNFRILENYPSMTLEDKLNRNFTLYKCLKSFFNCEVEYYLQPTLLWSKEMSNEEKILFDYSKKYFTKISNQAFDTMTNQTYVYLKDLLSKISKKNEIKFFDLNTYFKDTLTKQDWCFVDGVHCNDRGYKEISNFIKLNHN